MRVLIVDHLYPGFMRGLYRADPELAGSSYSHQRQAINDALFSETQHEVRALERLGHHATDHLLNAAPLNLAWAAEAGVSLPKAWRPTIRLRRGWLPWVSSPAPPGAGLGALLARIDVFKPDVVHIQCVDGLRPAEVREIRSRVPTVSGQIAAPVPGWVEIDAYDLVVSSLPNYVDRFRRDGTRAEWLPLAFEPSIQDRIHHERDTPVSFVGSLSPAHADRIEMLERIARSVPIEVWSADVGRLRDGSPLKQNGHGAAWGIDMYGVLARSRITINHHIDIAAGYANNLRLYEATGMGCLLVTDDGKNLGDLFDVGREVLTYRDAQECGEILTYYLAHPIEASEIAAAGQARTLREHTWDDRMARLLTLFGTLAS
jgi:spore maturation protein CgeB